MKSKHPYLEFNAHVFAEFEKIALKRIKGGKRVSAKSIFENIRDNSEIHEKIGPLKINNNYTALLAREFIEKYPEYKSHFALRDSQFDDYYRKPKPDSQMRIHFA